MERFKYIFVVVFLSVIAISQVQANEQLATDSGCMNCHKVDGKGIWPSLKEIATKYKADSGAEAALVDKVKSGGSGTWGTMPMPPNSPRISDADIQTMVKWILAM